jgi:hypothetical protein
MVQGTRQVKKLEVGPRLSSRAWIGSRGAFGVEPGSTPTATAVWPLHAGPRRKMEIGRRGLSQLNNICIVEQ